MEPLPYTEAGARIVFYSLVAIFVIGEVRTRIRSRANQRGAAEEWHSFAFLVACIYLGVILGILAASKFESAAIEFARRPIFVLGALLTAAGIAFRQWAILALGDSFTVDVRVRPGQPVVEAGPYRHLAHPSYTGMIATFVGIGLMLGNWASLICLALVPTVGLVFRIHTEERALLSGIGEPYRRFLAGRRRLLPGVW